VAHRRRVGALKALVIASLPVAEAAVVGDELDRVCDAGLIRKLPRRYLLEVIHSSRAIDTGLQAYLRHRAGVGRDSIGKVLYYLNNTGIGGITLPTPAYTAHIAAVARVRNRYAHEAGAFPSGLPEVETLLDDMHACLTDVFAL
jgi:hypothetical protein